MFKVYIGELKDWLKRQPEQVELNLDVLEHPSVRPNIVGLVAMRGKSGGVVFVDYSTEFIPARFRILLGYAGQGFLTALFNKGLFTNGGFSFVDVKLTDNTTDLIKIVQPNKTELYWDVVTKSFV